MTKKKLLPDISAENTKFLKHSLAAWGLPILDIRDTDAVRDRLELYFRQCSIDNTKPNLSGLCLFLGINRRTLWQWRTGKRRDQADFQKVILQAVSVLESELVNELMDGSINPVSAIFLLKSCYGFEDQQTIRFESKPEDNDADTLDDIRKRYAFDAEIYDYTDDTEE